MAGSKPLILAQVAPLAGWQFPQRDAAEADAFHRSPRTGLPLAVCGVALEQARSRDLLVRDALQLRPTLQGQHFLNDLLELFLPA